MRRSLLAPFSSMPNDKTFVTYTFFWLPICKSGSVIKQSIYPSYCVTSSSRKKWVTFVQFSSVVLMHCTCTVRHHTDTNHCRWTTKHWLKPFLQFNTSSPVLTENKPIQNSQHILFSMQLIIYVALCHIIKPHQKLEHPIRRAWDQSPAESKSSCISEVPMLPVVHWNPRHIPMPLWKGHSPSGWAAEKIYGLPQDFQQTVKTSLVDSHSPVPPCVCVTESDWQLLSTSERLADSPPPPWFPHIIKISLFFNLQIPFWGFGLGGWGVALKKEKNPFSVNLSIEYLGSIRSFHFKNHNLMLHICSTCLCAYTSTQISVLWRTSEALKRSFSALRR